MDSKKSITFVVPFRGGWRCHDIHSVIAKVPFVGDNMFADHYAGAQLANRGVAQSG